MERYLWDIGEDQQDLLYTAGFSFPSHFEVRDSRENIRDSIPLGKSALNRVKNEDSPLNLDAAEFLLSATHRSEPRFKNLDVEDIISDTWDYSKTKAELLKEGSTGFQEVLMQPFKPEEVEEMFDVSRPQAKKIRNGKAKRLDLEGVEEAFERTLERLSHEPEVEGDILFGPWYHVGVDDPVIIEDAGPEEVRKVRDVLLKLDEIESSNPHATGFLKAYSSEGFDSIYRKLDEGSKYLKAKNNTEGQFLGALRELGLVEKFGGDASPWELQEGKEWYRLVEREVEGMMDEETGQQQTYTDEELIQMLSTALNEDVDSISELDDIESLPNSKLYGERFESFYNAYWRAGEDKGQKRYDQDIVADLLREYTHENGEIVPSMTELTEESVLTDNTIYNHFDSYDDLLKEAGLYTERQIQQEDLDPTRYQSRDLLDQFPIEAEKTTSIRPTD